MISQVRIEPTEADLVEGDVVATVVPPNTVPTAGHHPVGAFHAKNVAPRGPVEVAERTLLMFRVRRCDIRPGHFAATRVPPGDAGRQKEVVLAITVEVALSVAAVGIKARVVGAPPLPQGDMGCGL